MSSPSTTGESVPGGRITRPQTIVDRVAEQLRLEIRNGALPPGTPLRQNELAERLGVSITPVREAFTVLEREGLVQRSSHRSVVVFRPTIKELLDGFDIRAALEALAARRAAMDFPPEDIRRLREILEAMAEPGQSDADYLRLNSDFHGVIERVAQVPKLQELIAAQRGATNAYMMFLGGEPASFDDTRAEHEAIVKACESGDPERAAAAAEQHIHARAAALRERFLKSNNQTRERSWP